LRALRLPLAVAFAVALLTLTSTSAWAHKARAPGTLYLSGGVSCPFSGVLRDSGAARISATLSGCAFSSSSGNSRLVTTAKLSGSYNSSPIDCATLSTTAAPIYGEVRWRHSLHPALLGSGYSEFSPDGEARVVYNISHLMASRCASSRGIGAIHVTGTITLGPYCGPGTAPVTIYPIAGHGPCGDNYNPLSITTGPDGALWFTNSTGGSLGRITTSGVITHYPVGRGAVSVTTGPDGALWFTSPATLLCCGSNLVGTGASIGRLTTSGTVTTYPIGTGDLADPGNITAGPDGALWFAQAAPSAIGRITTSGVITKYSNPSFSGVSSITAGPDGALWFTTPGHLVGTGLDEHWADPIIGRMSTSGAVATYSTSNLFPNDITAGPDGALWFTTNGSIGRITTSGVVTMFSGPDIEGPDAITSGPDGALWFTNYSSPADVTYEGSVGRITTSGAVSLYTSPGINVPYAPTSGPDGALWFVNDGNDTIGRIPTP